MKNGGATQLNHRNNSVSINLHNQKNPQLQHRNSTTQKKKVENLPRTGIEYPFTKERRLFITTHKEFEPLSEHLASQLQVGEYMRNDSERACAPPNTNLIVYDCIDSSPHYDNEDPLD